MSSCSEGIPDFIEEAANQAPSTSGRSSSAGEGHATACAAGPSGARRLETHVWHARRMVMSRQFGHVLAERTAGRGRGSRSVMHVAETGCFMHDAGYEGAIQLGGSVTAIKALLRRLSDSRHVDALFSSHSFRCGRVERQMMLHRCGQWPSQRLAPAAIMMGPHQPSGEPDRSLASFDQDIECLFEAPWSGGVPPPAPPVPGAPPCGTSEASQGPPARSMWLWVHAAAFHTVLTELRLAAGVAAAGGPPAGAPHRSSNDVSIEPRSGQLRRIEVVGARAVQAVCAVFSCRSEAGARPNEVLRLLQRCPALQVQLPEGVVLGTAALLPGAAGLHAAEDAEVTQESAEGRQDRTEFAHLLHNFHSCAGASGEAACACPLSELLNLCTYFYFEGLSDKILYQRI